MHNCCVMEWLEESVRVFEEEIDRIDSRGDEKKKESMDCAEEEKMKMEKVNLNGKQIKIHPSTHPTIHIRRCNALQSVPSQPECSNCESICVAGDVAVCGCV